MYVAFACAILGYTSLSMMGTSETFINMTSLCRLAVYITTCITSGPWALLFIARMSMLQAFTAKFMVIVMKLRMALLTNGTSEGANAADRSWVEVSSNRKGDYYELTQMSQTTSTSTSVYKKKMSRLLQAPVAAMIQ